MQHCCTWLYDTELLRRVCICLLTLPYFQRGLLDELHRITPNDPEHLPREIELIETFRQHHPKLPQLACLDTAFHHTMPRVAKILPIPRRFDAKGVQRYGFHGVSHPMFMIVPFRGRVLDVAVVVFTVFLIKMVSVSIPVCYISLSFLVAWPTH